MDQLKKFAESADRDELMRGIAYLQSILDVEEHDSYIEDTKGMLNDKFPEYYEFTESIYDITNHSSDGDGTWIMNNKIKLLYHNKKIVVAGIGNCNHDREKTMRIYVTIEDKLLLYELVRGVETIHNENMLKVLNYIGMEKNQFIEYLNCMLNGPY